MSSNDRKADLVFEGGGVKGIGLAGAYATIAERGFTPHGVAGTSAGAITAALVAAGYTADELADLVATMPYAEFKDRAWEDRLPLVGHGLSVLLDRGIYEGKAFHAWIAEKLAAKGITRFGQLVDPDAEDPAQRYRLRVIASDVTQRRMLVLPNDAHLLGLDPDELEIAYAVRMSMSIPFFFEPVLHTNPKTGEEHLIVDGGMLSNFPVWLFDCEGREPRWPTFGLMLVEGSCACAAGACGPRAPRDDAARLRQGDHDDDDGGARSPLCRAGRLRPDDPDPHAGRGHDGVRHHARPRGRALPVRPRCGGRLPRPLGLRRLHPRLPLR